MPQSQTPASHDATSIGAHSAHHPEIDNAYERQPSDLGTVPFHLWLDMRKLSDYMASDAYKSAQPFERIVCEEAVKSARQEAEQINRQPVEPGALAEIDEARDLAYEHFCVAGAIAREVDDALPRDYGCTPEALRQRTRDAVSDALYQMLRTVHGDEVMLDVYRSYVEIHSSTGSCLDLAGGAS